MAEKIRWGVSADSSGLLSGTPDMWKFLYMPAIAAHSEGFVGYEMYPWLSAAHTRSIMERAKVLKMPIARIHGRTGGMHEANDLFGRAVMTVLNEGMVDTCDLIRNFGLCVPSILVHAPELRKKNVRELLYQQPELVNCLAVENHLHAGAAGTALDGVLMLKKMGVNVRLVFDLFHCWSAADHLPDNERWDEVCRQNDM
ncbi:MAG: hypothetical protein Q7T18_01395, partial [Sedimentisphaerales bacterium]|nr:hypothetical protein [Sedimentisphaerales bacterium]